MSKLKEFVWRAADDMIIIDNRIEKAPAYTLTFAGDGRPVINLKENANHTWTPFLILHKTERYTPEEWEKYAQLICDTLNADWVKRELEDK